MTSEVLSDCLTVGFGGVAQRRVSRLAEVGDRRELARACALPAILVSRSSGPSVLVDWLAYSVVVLGLAGLVKSIYAHVLSVLRGCPPPLLKVLGKFSQPERSDAQHLGHD